MSGFGLSGGVKGGASGRVSGNLADGSIRVSNPSLIFDGKTIKDQGDDFFSQRLI